MTQLDRLEALAETAWEGYRLPDLIRVARAAKEVWDSVPSSFDHEDPMVQRNSEALVSLAHVLAPLYREVES